METNDLKEQIEKCPFNGVYVLQSPHHQLDIHLLTNALKAFLDEHTALEQRVAQYEEWLRMIEIGIGDLPYFAKQALDGDELKSPLSNALKGGGK